MKMESHEVMSTADQQQMAEDGYASQCEQGYGPYSRPALPLLHPAQSGLADIQLQQQQLLHQFSILHRNIAHKNNNVSVRPPAKTTNHPLFSHGCCKWAGCEAHCQTLEEFHRHLARCHILDDKSTAQTKVQIQIVEQLEQQLQKEQHRLKAMMDHLKRSRAGEEDRRLACLPFLGPASPPDGPGAPPGKAPSHAGPVRRRTVKSEDGEAGPLRGARGDRAGQDVESEMSENREFYLSQDVRPPFTYAALIRQAINESRCRQLTLNEIYNWFQANFAFFRRNAATWKNAVRHNLSLHKCFSRVENVKGAVWTVDEVEFHRRRPQRNTESHNNNRENSPPGPAAYEETFNRSLQSALLNLGKTGEHYLACLGPLPPEEASGPRPPVSPPRMVAIDSQSVYPSGGEEDSQCLEEPTRSPEAGPGRATSPEAAGGPGEDSLPQDLSMISHRNADS